MNNENLTEPISSLQGLSIDQSEEQPTESATEDSETAATLPDANGHGIRRKRLSNVLNGTEELELDAQLMFSLVIRIARSN